jgi:EmrB/QacA subfamily drug resistance transporter
MIGHEGPTPPAGRRRIRDRLLAEPRRPRTVAEHPHAEWLTVATVSVGAFMGQLDASIVNLAYPTLQHAFDASLGSVQWVGLSYLTVLIAALAVVGRTADMLGRKLLYTYGFVVFGLGSALCAAAPSLVVLDAARAGQAIGAAMLQANSVAIIAASLPRGRLGRGIGVQGTAQALGLAFGPLAGGVLIGLGGWRLIFLVNVPIGVIGATTSWLFVPRSRDLSAREPFDWPGVLLSVPALLALLLALTYGNEHGWGSPETVALVVVCLAAGAGFVLRERATAHPLIDLGLFRRRRFSVGAAAGLGSFMVLFGLLFVAPFYLERSLGASPATAGLLLTALPVGMALAAPVAGRLADTVGARPPTVAGMMLAAAGIAVAAAAPGTASLLAGLALAGVGVGVFTPANNASMMASVPRRRLGVASGLVNLTRGLGSALGLSLTALVFDVAAGAGHGPVATARGFTHAMAFLCAVAAVTAAVAALRRPRALERPVREV